MWIVVIGLLQYLSFSNNLILTVVHLTLGIILLLTTSNLMSDNIEFLYLISAILFTLYSFTSGYKQRIFLLLKLVVDFLLYILAGTIVDYSWVFTLPLILTILQLALVKISPKGNCPVVTDVDNK